jgi:Flp pilus assembly pilin Flp
MLKGLKKHLARLHRDERGAMSVETILILALIAIPLIIVLYLFRDTVAGWFKTQKEALNTDASTPPPS